MMDLLVMFFVLTWGALNIRGYLRLQQLTPYNASSEHFVNFAWALEPIVLARDVIAIGLVFAWAKVIKFLRYIPVGGPMVQAATFSFINIRVLIFLLYFLYFSFVFMVGCVVAFGADVEMHGGFLTSFLSVLMQQLGLQDGSFLVAMQQHRFVLGTVMWLLITIVGTVVLMNLFIAVVSQEYETMHMTAETDWQMSLNELMGKLAHEKWTKTVPGSSSSSSSRHGRSSSGNSSSGSTDNRSGADSELQLQLLRRRRRRGLRTHEDCVKEAVRVCTTPPLVRSRQASESCNSHDLFQFDFYGLPASRYRYGDQATAPSSLSTTERAQVALPGVRRKYEGPILGPMHPVAQPIIGGNRTRKAGKRMLAAGEGPDRMKAAMWLMNEHSNELQQFFGDSNHKMQDQIQSQLSHVVESHKHIEQRLTKMLDSQNEIQERLGRLERGAIDEIPY
jgi:hypothetical protein